MNRHNHITNTANNHAKVLQKMDGGKNMLLTSRQQMIKDMMNNGGKRDECVICGDIEKTRIVRGQRICEDCLSIQSYMQQ
jgi:hypothetical protein